MESFIEVYDNALPDDMCDYLMSIFDREEATEIASGVTKSVGEVRTALDPEEGQGDPVYVEASHMTLHSYNFLYDSIVADLDYILKYKMFEYNQKYMMWSSKLNMDLIPTIEERQIVEEQSRDVDYLNEFIHRHGEYVMKKYKHPNDGYHVWHTDWAPRPEFIGRQIVTQFYLNDVEEGGETEFYHQKMKIKPKKGRLVIWPVGWTHYHKGHKPISNDKYVLSAWYTQKNIMR